MSSLYQHFWLQPFLKTVVRLGFSLTNGHSGRVAMGVKQNVGSHSTLCEGHVFCRPHHTEDFRKKKMVTTITGIGLVYHIIFFYPIKCLSIKKMIDYKHFILRLKNWKIKSLEVSNTLTWILKIKASHAKIKKSISLDFPRTFYLYTRYFENLKWQKHASCPQIKN